MPTPYMPTLSSRRYSILLSPSKDPSSQPSASPIPVRTLAANRGTAVGARQPQKNLLTRMAKPVNGTGAGNLSVPPSGLSFPGSFQTAADPESHGGVTRHR